MNKVILMGRLTRDPEMRYSQDMAIARFSLAVDRRFKKQGDTVTADFFNCTASGKQGEFVEKYLKQGTKVLVTGRIQNDNYTNKDGQKVYSVQVIVEEIEFAESKNTSTGGTGYAQDMPGGERIEPTAPGDDFMNINPKFDKDLPFGD